MWLLLIAAIGQVAYRIEPQPGAEIASAEAIVQSCRDDVGESDDPKFARYISVGEQFDADHAFAAVSQVANSTFSRTPNVIRPVRVTDRLFRFDLEDWATSDADRDAIAALYELFAPKETFFTSPNDVEVKCSDGVWRQAKLTRRHKSGCSIEYGGKSLTVAAADIRTRLVDGLAELAEETGSRVPVMRHDEFVANAFSSVNGGLYYQLTGISGDLRGTVERFAGRDAADKLIKQLSDVRSGRLDPAVSQSRALVNASNVTGRQRLVQVFFGANGVPSVGPQVFSITLDVAEDNDNPDSDPLRNLRRFEKYDGGEAIFSLPNGMLAYVVFDAADRIIESVPDKVASDHEARSVRRNVATTRVFSGISCANCHDAVATNFGWQPVTNDALEVDRLLSPIDDKSAKERRRALQELAAQYGARDLESVLNLSRFPYQKQVHLATGKRSSKEVTGAVADAHWGYHYDRVTPRLAALDLGHSFTEEGAQAFLLKIPPVIDADGGVREDAAFARLKDGRSLVPTQWRTIRAEVRASLGLELAP